MTWLSDMTWLQGITLAIALIGTGLSVFNTVVSYRRGSIRFRIIEVWNDRSTPSLLNYQIVIQNFGTLNVAVDILIIQIKGKGRVLVWQQSGAARRIIVAGQKETFSLPSKIAFMTTPRFRATIVVKMENGQIKHLRAKQLAALMPRILEQERISNVETDPPRRRMRFRGPDRGGENDSSGQSASAVDPET